jgi:hypothetical protein
MLNDSACGPAGVLSRREFLRLSEIGIGSILFSPLGALQVPKAISQGRVADLKCDIYDRPSLSGKILKTYWKDMVLSISAVTIGDLEPEHNRTWYLVENEGYAHSGSVQPVKTQLNPPVSDLPPGGALVEVTVPYTDAYWSAGRDHQFAYRFYFETTYWATELVEDDQGGAWYRIQDDKWDTIYYAPARHLRLIPAPELAPTSPSVPPEEKRLEVRLAAQTVTAFEYHRPVFMARIASGAIFSNGRHLTPLGRHKTFHKRPSRHMAAGDLASNGYDLPGVPWICYINEKGVAFHGTYWHNDFGRPRSHGCINLSSAAAKWIYLWTLPNVPPELQDVYENFGTRVDVVE